MSDIKQVGPGHWIGPEDDGYQPHFFTTDNAVYNYPFGSLIQEDPLQPANKRIEMDYDESKGESIGEFFETFSAGGHEHYLDMRVHSVTSRGKGLGLSILLGLIYLAVFWTVRAVGNVADQINWLDWGVLSTLIVITFGELFRPIATPVRFHKTNQEVYVWHKKVLYRIPWYECEMSVIVAKSHMGYGYLKDGYELVLWLNPKHAFNKDLSGQKHTRLPLVNNMTYHSPIYGYWEYVRRYMTGDTPFWYRISEEPRVPGFNHKILREDGFIRGLFGYLTVIPVVFLFKPAHFALWWGPLRRRWPKEVHEWTGEKCNWH